MDVVFDIDGTLANAEHRLHYIVEPSSWTGPFKKNWDSFLSDEEVAKDSPIEPMFFILNQHLATGHRASFITGRPEKQRWITTCWLSQFLRQGERPLMLNGGSLYMRTDGDRRPSSTVKEELLIQARSDGFDPTLVFEDRADDTAMWRRNGLICCQVAEGNY